MNRRGTISGTPKKKLRLIVGAQFFWLLYVFAMGIWWGRLVLKQASQIVFLEKSMGVGESTAHDHFVRTQTMVHWEGGVYFGFLLVITGVILWLYWRDETRSRGLQAFFASVTHELRTPLTSIRLQAESIAENLENQPDEKAHVERLLQDTLRLEAQVERTLELARIEGGGKLFTQQLRIKPWIERMIDSWRSAYALQAEFHLEIEDVVIDADPSAIQVILRNLIENSLRHSKRSRVKITIRSSSTPHRTLLRFIDDGAAFEGDVSQLGQIFYKGKNSQGAGVGLYLVSTLMKRMSGTASFSRTAGFEVALDFHGVKSRG